MNNSNFTVLLDMDGVLVNFVDGICRALGKPNPYQDGRGAGEWDIGSLLGVSEEEFWAPCGEASFWSDLEWMPGGRAILKMVERQVGRTSVFLLTSPSLSPESWSGKAEWVSKHMPDYRLRVLMGLCKHLCAKPGQILVDDADHNIEAFTAAGGQAVLVPRMWNSNHFLADKTQHYTYSRLWELTK